MPILIKGKPYFMSSHFHWRKVIPNAVSTRGSTEMNTFKLSLHLFNLSALVELVRP